MLSVIVPVYNVESYLRRCVDSIINQTFTDIEVILVDDGSTDMSGAICDEYAIKFDNIRVVHKENGGLSSARNVGIDNAKGDMIAFVDSDDYINKNMYKNMISIMKKTNAEIISCMFQIVNENDNPISTNEISSAYTVYEGISKYNQLWDNDAQTVVQCNKIFKKEVFSDIRYPQGRIHEDVFVIHRELSKCTTYVFVEQPYYYYMIRKDSIMHNESIKSIRDAIEGYEDRIIFFDRNGLISCRDKTIKILFEYVYQNYRKNYYLKAEKNCKYLKDDMERLLANYKSKSLLDNKIHRRYKHLKTSILKEQIDIFIYNNIRKIKL